MLTGKQKSYLRGLANKESAVFQIGKEGLTENIIISISDYLAAHELCKFSLLKTCDEDIREVAINVASMTGSEVVQLIGRVAVVYRHEKDGKIVLPR